MVVDLQGMESAKKAAAEILRLTGKIDDIINNAGIMASPYHKTVDGLESQFHTNLIGHFVLIELIRSHPAKRRPSGQPDQ